MESLDNGGLTGNIRALPNFSNIGTEENAKQSEITNMDDNFNIRDFLDCSSMTEEEISRCEFWVSANRIVRESGRFNFEKEKIPVNNTWNLDIFEKWLEGYHDKQLIQYLKFGWPLNAINTEENLTIPENQAGALNNEREIDAYIAKELKYGAIIGPFNRNPFGRFARFSPIDTRPKRDSDELRIIMNLSYPFNKGSVNESISKEEYVSGEDMTLRYPSVDDLCKIIRKKVKGKNGKAKVKVRLFKRDLRRAYRQLWMCPSSIMALGFCHKGKLYFDVALSMGSRSAAYCCQRTTNGITYVYQKMGYDDVNYLDDLGAAEEESRAEEAYDCLGWILDSIGIQESKEKATPPAYIIVFLGILINAITLTLEITHDRREELKQMLSIWKSKKSSTLKELQSLLGKLSFVCNTVRAGRVFISRIINQLKDFPKKGRRRIDTELSKDILWWDQFMSEFDGISVIPDDWSRPDEIFSTDASLTMCGGWSEPQYFKCRFPKWMKERGFCINELELAAFVLALKIWQEKVKNKNVLAYCDNQCTVEVINRGKAHNKIAQEYLREIVYILANNNAALKVIYISSECNRIPDSLSRWNEGPHQKFRFNSLTNNISTQEILVNERNFDLCNKW